LAAAVVAGALAGAVALAGPASAHTGVTIEPAVAGATNALVSVSAQAESPSAGVASLKVVLPAGIAPADVTLVTAPDGWTLQPDADGYTVGGPALPSGRDARHQVRVRQLPMVPTLAFRILQTYNDGRIDRWIEVPSAANPNPDNPAPVVSLAAPPGGFPSPTPSPPSPTPSAVSSAPQPTGTENDVLPGPPADDDASGWVPWLVAVGLLAVAAGVALVLLRRRRVARGAS
jgi:hypothetical protein